MSLTFEIVTPRGLMMRSAGLDEVVLRQKDAQSGTSSEITVGPNHSQMQVKLPAQEICLVEGSRCTYVRIDGGFAEIKSGHVSVLTTSATEVVSTSAGMGAVA